MIPFDFQFIQDFIQRHVLVLEGLQTGFSNLFRQFPDAQIFTVDSECQGVHKKPHDILELGMMPVGHGRADDEIVLMGVTAEKNVKPAKQGHVQGGIGFTGKGS